MSAHDWQGVATICGLFFALLLTSELWFRLGTPKPEWTRKLVHLGGGLIALSLPWLIDEPLVVLGLTCSLSLLFAIGGKTRLLRSLHGVTRSGRGSEYYPLAIFLVFAIAGSRTWLYVAAVLVLAVADAFAALIGSRYGVMRYQVEDEFKSVEGSGVFFILAFLAVHLPVLLMTNLPRPVVVLSALLVALLVTGFEAIALRGTDNIFVPIAVCFILGKITTKPLSEITYQLLSIVLIVVVVGLIAWRLRSFNVGGALAVILFTFATWSLGSRRWALPVLLAVAVFSVARHAVRSRTFEPLRVRIITHALLVPLIVLLAANLTGRYTFFFAPYLAACASVLAFVLWDGALRAGVFPQINQLVVAAVAGLAAALLVSVGAWMTQTFRSIAIVVAVTIVMAIVNAGLHLRRIAPATDEVRRGWSGISFVLALAAALAVMACSR